MGCLGGSQNRGGRARKCGTILAMTSIKTLVALAFVFGCTLAQIGTSAVSGALAQRTPDTARPLYDGSDAPNALKLIYIDQDCRILPGPTQVIPGKKSKPFNDSVICHLETVAQSNHMEEKIVGDQLYRSRVTIAEQEFVLQNITDRQAEFIVEVPVNSDWTVDSDPQPVSTEGDVAVFPVYAEPGQIVRLHVGLRHAQPLKTKFIGAKTRAQQGTAGN